MQALKEYYAQYRTGFGPGFENPRTWVLHRHELPKLLPLLAGVEWFGGSTHRPVLLATLDKELFHTGPQNLLFITDCSRLRRRDSGSEDPVGPYKMNNGVDELGDVILVPQLFLRFHTHHPVEIEL